MQTEQDFNWYAIQAFSGKEKKAIITLKERITRLEMSELFGEILFPTENVFEIKSGKKRKEERRLFPGYLFVQMKLTSESWHLIKHSPNLLGFVGDSKGRGKIKEAEKWPEPIPKSEIDLILGQIKDGIDKPKPKVLFTPGEYVRVVNGPFNDFSGTVEEVDFDKNRLKILLTVFGRSTPVDMDFNQVVKLK